MFLDLIRETSTGEMDAGEEIRFNCAFCGEEHQKFYVQKEDPFLWHCKHCDRSGNPITFAKELYGINFPDAKELLETYDFYVGDTNRTKMNAVLGADQDEMTESEKLFMLLENSEYKEQYLEEESQLGPTPLPTGFKYLADNTRNVESYPYFNYLIKRKINPALAMDYKIGYVEDSGILNPKTGREIPLKKSLVFPTFDDKGVVIYWNTRSILKDPFIKAINAPQLDENHYSKRDSIFNLNRARHTGKIIISEGVFNAISTGRSGVATFGKQVTDKQVALLHGVYDDNPKTKFIVFLDNDAKSQIMDLASRIKAFTDEVYIVINPYPGKDANDLEPELVAKMIIEAPKYEPNSGSELQLILS